MSLREQAAIRQVRPSEQPAAAEVRILVAAPEISALAIARALGNTGAPLQIEQTHGAEQAMTLLAGGGFDCALIDLGLPAFAGQSAVRDWRESGIDTPLVIVLDHAQRERALQLIEAGASDCLTRGELNGERLLISLHAAIKAHRIEARLLAAERKLSQIAMRDPLTRLPGRTLFLDRMEQIILIAQREHRAAALLVIDLNRFGQLNQTLGHHTGDRVLTEAAERLTARLRAADTLARIGDDQFAVIMTTGGTRTGAITTAQKLHEAMSIPFTIGNRSIAVGAAIGVALYPTNGSTADQLLRACLTATQRAKAENAPYCFPDPDSERDAASPPLLLQELQRATQQNEFVLHYQPLIELESRQICGVEALIRWTHADRGLILPDTFIPLAEQCGLIDAITFKALDSGFAEMARWREAGIDLPISFNLSALSLRNPRLVQNIEERLGDWRIPAGFLTLELTESAIISDGAGAGETLSRLHELGIAIAIDDFGTGYTSLSYLRKLPLSHLKIDKSFVLNMREVHDDKVIVHAIIELGRNLGLQVVAEGVEDAETFELLRDMGCAVAQGYHMARPMPSARLLDWLRDSRFGLKPLE